MPDHINEGCEASQCLVVNCRFLTQDVTGVQRYAEQIVQELVRLRNDLVLVAPNVTLRRTHIGGVSVHQVGFGSGHFWEQVVLPRYLRMQGSPLLLSLANTGPVGYPRQAVVIHDVSYRRIPETYGVRFRVAYSVLLPLLAHRARKVITVSDFSRKEIAETFRMAQEDIAIVSNSAGISPGLSPVLELAAETPYFLAVGSHAPHKNLDLLIKAFTQYRATTKSQTRLKLVGGSSQAFSEARRGDCSEGVDLLGRVDDEELARLYSGARGFFFPSLYEGFGIPPLEAQAFGCPVASSSAASLPEVLGTSARYFEPTSESEIIAALRDLDENRILREKLRKTGFENLARFSWESSAMDMSRLLDRLLTGV